jgi:predicted phosphoadenosine phosphosulfate sulfurtransferase
LGVETWALIPFIPDWRWFLDRQDSPWYPGMRLFRLVEPDNWAEAIERVRAALEERAACRCRNESSGAV